MSPYQYIYMYLNNSIYQHHKITSFLDLYYTAFAALCTLYTGHIKFNFLACNHTVPAYNFTVPAYNLHTTLLQFYFYVSTCLQPHYISVNTLTSSLCITSKSKHQLNLRLFLWIGLRQSQATRFMYSIYVALSMECLYSVRRSNSSLPATFSLLCCYSDHKQYLFMSYQIMQYTYTAQKEVIFGHV